MELVYDILQATFFTLIPLLIVALGGLFSERTGVVNIALEGIMIMGAFIGIFVISLIEQGSIPDQLVLIIGLLVGGVVGMLFSAFHAFASINLKADQTISGTALNIFAPAVAIFVARSMLGGSKEIKFMTVFRIKRIPILSDIPFFGRIFFEDFYITFYIGLLTLAISWFILYKTRLGLRIRSCGENPHAADSAGINIYKIRYIGVLTSGFLAGMGGVVFVMSASQAFAASVSGYGFLAIAVLIFGNWQPKKILFASFFFGLMTTLSAMYTSIPLLNNLGLSEEFYNIIPYVATLIVLAILSKSSRAPKAVGVIYDKGAR